MENLNSYKKYYFLEDYLFGEVSNNFNKNHCLTTEEFFAIVIWKRNASKTKIKNGLLNKNKSVNDLSIEICKAKTPQEKLNILTSIPQIGISIASAILAVCYPNDFTIVDIRACNSLQKEPFCVADFPYERFVFKNDASKKLYLRYVDKCKELSSQKGFCLRDFDRILFGMDWYDGKDGLKELTQGKCV